MEPRAQLEIVLLRHGETQWSKSHRHTGTTDVDLTPAGEAQAWRLGRALGGKFEAVLCSPRLRARKTAELAGLVPFEVVEELAEWDYGELEGLTTAQIRERFPGWTIWSGPWPGGEDSTQVAARADLVVQRLLSYGDATRVAVVAHGHILRALSARWVGAPVAAGGWFSLDTATICQLGWEHDYRVVQRWNVPALARGASMR